MTGRGILFVVAAGRADLVDLLQQRFADVPGTVQIVRDRRVGDRRQHALSVGVDRRKSERRTRDVQDDLNGIGWAVIRRR